MKLWFFLLLVKIHQLILWISYIIKEFRFYKWDYKKFVENETMLYCVINTIVIIIVHNIIIVVWLSCGLSVNNNKRDNVELFILKQYESSQNTKEKY